MSIFRNDDERHSAAAAAALVAGLARNPEAHAAVMGQLGEVDRAAVDLAIAATRYEALTREVTAEG
jgi:hypothetical protein